MSGQQQSKEQKSAAMDLRYQNGKEVFKGGVLGAFIGLAVIVPGVSGSAVAIIFRLYEKLLYALAFFCPSPSAASWGLRRASSACASF